MSVYGSLTFAPMLITDVFETVRASKAWYDKNKLLNGYGKYPYVSRSAATNGCDDFIIAQDLPPNDGNAITIGVDTQTTFYQPVPFYTSVKVQVLRHHKLNRLNAPILVTLLRAQMSKFQWGNGASLDRLKATRIMVPVVNQTNRTAAIDWEGMTKLGEELLQKTLSLSRCARQTTAHASTDLPQLTFAPMLITDVFESLRASSTWYDKSKLSKSRNKNYPFVSRTRATNSIDIFCSHQDKIPERSNAITIGLDPGINIKSHTVYLYPQTSKLTAVVKRSHGKFSRTRHTLARALLTTR